LARQIHCEIFRDGARFGYRVHFCDSDHFHYISSSCEGLERALEAHDGHQERNWERPGPFAAADVVLVSDEYKPESVGWRMKQQEIQDPRKTPFRRQALGTRRSALVMPSACSFRWCSDLRSTCIFEWKSQAIQDANCSGKRR
jgi:hypothetical protein